MTHAPIAVALALSLSGAAVAGPSLFFSRTDVPTLRKRTESGECARVWREIREEADRLCTPGSAGYADPDQVDRDTLTKLAVRAHAYGRRLTEWVEALGFAYQITGHERYARHGARILVAAARKMPITRREIAKSFAGARGDIMRGFAVGLDWLGDAMEPEDREFVEQVAASYVENILAEARRKRLWWRPHHNFMGVALGGAGLLSLKLKDAYPQKAPRWRDECARLVALWFTKGFDEQGAYLEGTGYAHYGLTNSVRFADALLRAGGPDLLDHARLRRVSRFFAMSLLPGERVFDARNDANYAGLGDPWMLRLAAAHDDGLAKWLWERCGSGRSPMRIVWQNDVAPVAPTGRAAERFVGRGLCVWRTGWDKGDVMFSVEAGPFYPITHNQADKGHFTLYGLGRRWAIDSGYGNNRDPEGRAQTVAHNCILIDGKGQALSGAGSGTSGKIVAFENNETYGYALADCTEAYNRNSKNQPGVGVRRALRHCIFMWPSHAAPAYAIVLDDIQRDDKAHEYTWLMHTAKSMQVAALPDGVWLRGAEALGSGFVETPAGADGKGACKWTFEVGAAGRYRVWARVRASGEIIGKSDSFFVRVDHGERIAWHMRGAREWTWDVVRRGAARQVAEFRLAPGQHVLEFATREPGAQVDAIVVTSDPEQNPPVWDDARVVLLQAEAGEVTGAMRVVRQEEAKTATMRIVLSASAPVRWSVDAYDGHPRLRAAALARSPRFVAVLAPLLGVDGEPGVRVTRSRESTQVAVTWPQRQDTIMWVNSPGAKPAVAVQPR